ncbi:cation:proton antiporter family protein [Paenibacillus hexagrammi]|uniref:Cation:proton antiporter n=1 Tax=Paenibacillus hexagrammi TaxID=2908839 RepID=A0ABY3SFX0_9BACL|nr:cation:proton antiporter family protein [Paenibacillus sp. YPD9-1]UJF32355.1 cation:proton antiporter [Paenibacillus sp. YPD9-1]
MEHGNGSLGSLILVVTISFLVPILLYQLRLRVIPVVVAEILAGLILGKSGFNLVGSDPWLELLSLLGFIYLMFLSGVEIDFTSFTKQKTSAKKQYQPVVVACVIFVSIFLLSGVLSWGLVWAGFVNRVFLTTLIIGTISLGVVVPVLKERKMVQNDLGQTLLLITVLADFFTMILLAFYVSFLSNNMMRMLLLFLFFFLVTLIYLSVRKFASGKVFQVLSQSTIQFGTRAIFALILAIVFLSESLGVENILGAFLAGVIVSLLRPKKEFVHQLESFGYGFLIPIFFVMIGANLELKPLLTDMKLLLSIPLLLLMMFAAKVIPMMILKKWFSWREVISSGVLLSSKLSLVIAAATLALDLHIISESFHGALILVAILSCLIFPVIYNKMSPKPAERKTTISIVGMNHVSMPVAQELAKEDVYEIHIFTASSSTSATTEISNLHEQNIVRQVSQWNEQTLEQEGALEADMIVLATMDDAFNIRLARRVRAESDKRVLIRVEAPESQQELAAEGFEVFSTLYAARTVLRALIDSPGALKLLSDQDGSISEVTIRHLPMLTTLLRQLPGLENILILRIYRGESYLIPHGNTEIRLGDRLLVSGTPEQVDEFRAKVR